MPTDQNKEYKVSYSNASSDTITTTNPHWLATDYLDQAITKYGLTDRTSDMEKDIDNLKKQYNYFHEKRKKRINLRWN